MMNVYYMYMYMYIYVVTPLANSIIIAHVRIYSFHHNILHPLVLFNSPQHSTIPYADSHTQANTHYIYMYIRIQISQLATYVRTYIIYFYVVVYSSSNESDVIDVDFSTYSSIQLQLCMYAYSCAFNQKCFHAVFTAAHVY